MADEPAVKVVVSNRRARYEYHLEKPVEAGLVLTGSEVKSLRAGQAHLQESFVAVTREGLALLNAHIAPYSHGGYANHEPNRPRRLLLHRKEIDRLAKGVAQKGFTLVPLELYFKNGRAKLSLALGKGKKHYDKREATAERDVKRSLDRVLKGDRRAE
jgi:SsrA-binding protein